MDQDSRRGTRRVLGALLRPLAVDEVRARFWRRHLQVGVTLSLLAGGWLALNVAFGPHETGRVQTLVLAAVAVSVSPLLLLVPIERWSRDRRGALFFYGWSLSLIAMITLSSVFQGTLLTMVLLLVLTLTYAALAYPPLGVLLVGLVMAAALALATTWVTATDPGEPLMVTGVFVIFTLMTAWSSRNQWAARGDQEALARTLAVMAATDPLTGCLNRRAFLDALDDDLAADGHSHVVVLDLDGFKLVNDRFGHAAGDELLQDVADALRAQSGSGGRVARLGGDEFAVLLADDEDPVASSAGLRDAVARAAGGRGVTASVGTATAGERETATQVLARADAAMYRVKHRTRSLAPARG